MFGLNGHPGWGLNTLNSLYAKDDSKHLQDFMSPSGPVFLMVYKLQSDHYLRYEFPVDKLSVSTQWHMTWKIAGEKKARQSSEKIWQWNAFKQAG